MTIAVAATATAAAVAEAAAAVSAGFMAALPAALGGTTGAIGAGTGIGAGTAAGAGAAAAAGAGGISAGAGGIAGSIGAGLSGVVQGGLLGSALGAGTAALTGGDVGKGAAMGAATGAIGGGVISGAGEIGAGMSSAGEAGTIGETGSTVPTNQIAPAAERASMGVPLAEQTPMNATPFFDEVIPSSTNVAPMRMAGSIPSNGGIASVGADMTPAEMSSAIRAPLASTNLGTGSYGSNTEAINAVNNPQIPTSSPSNVRYIDKGIKLIKDNPAVAMQLGGAAMSMMGGTSSKQQSQTPATTSIYDPIPYTQQDIPRTTVPNYYDTDVGYAFGGSVTDTSQQGQMNPIVARAMQQVQQTQLQAQQPVQPQQTPAPQGIMGAQPMPQVKPAQPVQPMPQAQPTQMAATGGMMKDNLGGYSHGGIAGLTSAVGSGVSDDIPAQIGTSGKQPARLAANEFVIPARVVSELGQGSSEAGAKILQDMVNRVQLRRKKSIGKGKVAVDSKAIKELPA